MPRSFFRIFISGIILILFLIFLRSVGIIASSERAIQQLFTMPLALMTKGYHVFAGCVGLQKSFGQDDPENLKKTIYKLQQELVILQGKSQENELLRSQLRFHERSKIPAIVASVIGKLSDPQRNVLIINQGKRDGIKNGMPVIVNEGIIIGLIYSVSDSVSHVRLLSDSKSKLLAYTPSSEGVRGIIEGNFSLGLLYNLIPIRVNLVQNALVATSGLQEHIPKDLVIGTISTVEKKPTDLFQSAILAPSVDYSNLSIVSVLITY